MKNQKDSVYRHHEQTPAFQAQFKKHVRKLVEEFKKLRNPFEDDGNVELIQLDTRDVLGDAVIKTVNEVEEIGYRQAKEFTQKRLVEKIAHVDDTVKKNNLPLMSFENTSSSQKPTKHEKKLMQNDV